MKRKVLSIIGVAAISAAVVFNVSVGSHRGSLSDLALANIEALASVESTLLINGGGLWVTCWQTLTGIPGLLHTEKTYCTTCTAIPAVAWSSESSCKKN